MLSSLVSTERASAILISEFNSTAPRLLCTLRANVAVDYATLASGWWLALAGSPFQMTGLIQSISLSFDTSFDYGLFFSRRDET